MLRLLADENLNNHIVRGLLRRNAGLDNDVSTMTRYCYERVAAGMSMPGVFEVPRSLPVKQVIEDLLLLAQCSGEGEWEGQVRYLPL